MSLIRRTKAMAGRYLLKVKNLISRELHANASPWRASLSLAFGIFVGFSPFYGIHLLLVLPLAFLLRLNRPLVLLAVNTTILPFVPFWLAAGIFSGNLVVSLEKANSIVSACHHSVWGNAFDHIAGSLIGFCRRVLPDSLFDTILQGSKGHLMAKFVQWFIGCSLLAVVCAIGTLCITYPIFLRISVIRKRRLQAAKNRPGADNPATATEG
jgi:uncharacterized protein (DUF2062 family)